MKAQAQARARAARAQSQEPFAPARSRAAGPALSPSLFSAPPAPLPVRPRKTGAFAATEDAREPGIFLKDESFAEGHSEDDEDPELREAVEETISILFGVRGIHHVGPGRNERDERVVVVAAGLDFTQESLEQVPARVHRFETVLAVPFELLPLRRPRK